jgi:hypothetical protein
MSFVGTLLARYSYLPKVSFPNKVRYALWKHLFRQLIARKIVDDVGVLSVPRHRRDARPAPRRTFKTLVSVNGFNWSGSSAIDDLLQEYKTVTSSLSGTLDDSIEKRNRQRFEFDIVRAGCGVYSLEHLFETRNIFERDVCLRVFMSLVYKFYNEGFGDFYDDKFIELTRDFIRKLLATEVKSPTGFDYAPQLTALGTQAANFILGHDPNDKWQYVYYLKDLTVPEYRAIAREYILSILRTVESEDFLILDQGCADCSADIERFVEYFGPLKAIWCYRDPRDIYAAAQQARVNEEEGNVPNDPVYFVKWYLRALEPFAGLKHESLLVFRFEDMIMEYEKTVSMIEKFLGLKPEDHVFPKKYFIPAESFVRSIGLWKTWPEKEAIAYVKKELPQYCYRDDCECPK